MMRDIATKDRHEYVKMRRKKYALFKNSIIICFQGGGDQLNVVENITSREEGWFEGRDTNEILVRS